MRTNLRRSLDASIGVQSLLDIKFKVLLQILVENKDLSDEVIVILAEFANTTSAQLKVINEAIDGTIADMRIFGEEGLEKKLGFTIQETEQEVLEEEPEPEGYEWMNRKEEDDEYGE